MRTLIIATAIILGLGVCSGFGQAVAEGAMVHANSAAASAKMGSALGNALSKAMSGNAEKMESLSAAKIEHVPHASRKTLPTANSGKSSGPLVITSVRGANKPCTAVVSIPPPAANSSTAVPTAEANAAVSPHTATQRAVPTAQDCGPTSPSSSKSVINLAFPE